MHSRWRRRGRDLVSASQSISYCFIIVLSNMPWIVMKVMSMSGSEELHRDLDLGRLEHGASGKNPSWNFLLLGKPYEEDEAKKKGPG